MAADDLDEYLRGDSALSRQYRREHAPTAPRVLDRRVLQAARGPLQPPGVRRPPRYLAPLAFAASVLLSVALVIAIAFGPPAQKRADDGPHLVRTAVRTDASARLYSSDPQRGRSPSAWLADIAALRHAGRNREADAELRRFHDFYPGYPVQPSEDIRP